MGEGFWGWARSGGEPLLPWSKSASLERCLSRPDDELRGFRSCMRWMCLDQSSAWRALLSWSLFLLLALAVPLVSHFALLYSDHRRPYDSVVQLSMTAAASLSFLCLSSWYSKYGLRRFLFLDRIGGESKRVHRGYVDHLNRSFRILSLFVMPCFLAECGYKVWWYVAGARRIPFLGNAVATDVVACALELSSWVYRTAIFFLVCVLFRLICFLQILRLQDFATVFQEESDVAAVLREHLRIRRQLTVISHRFRKFIVAGLILVTASQFASLLLTTRPHGDVNLFNVGELAGLSAAKDSSASLEMPKMPPQSRTRFHISKGYFGSLYIPPSDFSKFVAATTNHMLSVYSLMPSTVNPFAYQPHSILS